MHKAWLAGIVPRQNPEPSIAFLSWSHLLFHTVKGTFLWTPTSAFVTSFSFELPVCSTVQSPLSPVQVLLYVHVPKHSVPVQPLQRAALIFS